MKIVSITVGASLTIAHPRVPYSNVKPEITLTAELNEHDDIDGCYCELRTKIAQLLTEQIGGLADVVANGVE